MVNILIKAYRKLSIKVFGNTVALHINLLYFTYIALVKLKRYFSIRNNLQIRRRINQQEINILYNNGFTKISADLSEADVKFISYKVDKLFTQPDKTVKTLEGYGLLRLKSCLQEVPELEKYILEPGIRGVLQGYFNSAYKVYNCDVYRTIPTAHKTPENKFNSLRWHFDNCPKALLKVMIYLTDTNVDNGALTLVNKRKSLELKKRGFWDRNDALKYIKEIEEHSIPLEAPAGTALIFSTHHCIHRATLPQNHHRDVAVFLVQPALVQQQLFTDKERLKFSYSYGYCVNPFRGTPLRYGSE